MTSQKITEHKLTNPDFQRSVHLCGYMHAGALGWELIFDGRETLRFSPEQFEQYLIDVGFRLNQETTNENWNTQLLNVVQYLLLKRLQLFHGNDAIPVDKQTGEQSGSVYTEARRILESDAT